MPVFIRAMLCLALLSPLADGDERSPTVEQALQSFRDGYDSEAWEPSGSRRPPFMRPLDDDGWKVRMRSLQAVIARGKESVPALADSLESGSVAERILAAQALGYLPAASVAESLRSAAESDPDAAVRLYAVDALGMLGNESLKPFFEKRLKSESNRDVKMHLNYALERGGNPVEPDVVKTLAEFDLRKIDSAKVGKPAPDFALKSAQGETIRLSDFRGKQNIVLVFIYGDT